MPSPASGGAEVSFGGATQVGGLLEQLVDFGSGLADIDIVALTQTFPADNKARGYIFGTPDGVTYGVMPKHRSPSWAAPSRSAASHAWSRRRASSSFRPTRR